MITNEQREFRKNYVGASDQPVLWGASPWRTPADLYLRKTGAVVDSEVVSDAIEVGNRAEDMLLDIAAEQLDTELLKQQQIIHPDIKTRMLCHPDGISRRGEFLVEAKTTSFPEDWGTPGTDQVPLHVALQALHQMACCPNAVLVLIPVLFGGPRLRVATYKIGRSQMVIRECERKSRDFMLLVDRREQPPGQVSVEIANRIDPEPGSIETVPAELYERYVAAQEASKEARTKYDAAAAEIKSLLAHSQYGDFGAADKILSYNRVNRTTINAKALEAKYPQIFAELATETTTRQLRTVRKRS